MNNEGISYNYDSGILAKIRRLKIEESLLLQNLKECFPRAIHADITNTNLSEYEKKSGKLINSYISIKNLFEEIKANTNSQEMLRSIEVDDVKNKILKLESNVKTLKKYLSAEITSLKIAEQELTKQMGNNFAVICKIKKQPKLRTMTYNKIIPSPVKVMMDSPFKCREIQEFQEFMSNSQTRYGSWLEYNHNTFVKHWQKYFHTEPITDLEQNITDIENLEVFHLFLEELLCKLKDVKEEDILSHIKWYLKYIHLKGRQQKALNNWKTNKKIIAQVKRNAEFNVKNNQNNFVDIGDLKYINKQDENKIVCKFITTSLEDLLPHKNKCKRDQVEQKVNVVDYKILKPQQNVHLSKSLTRQVQDKDRLLNPTKQWISRCNRNKLSIDKSYNNIEEIKTLRIPSWRLGLQDKRK